MKRLENKQYWLIAIILLFIISLFTNYYEIFNWIYVITLVFVFVIDKKIYGNSGTTKQYSGMYLSITFILLGISSIFVFYNIVSLI